MEQLCRRIHMPEEVTQTLLSLRCDPDLHKLTWEETWQEGLEELRNALGEDPNGFRELYCMLRCALDAKETYVALGLSEEIYYDTMGCFSRFVREHQESYGCYGFDRGFWTVRQISCRLFRIGQLEYELIRLNGVPTVSLHIPTDTVLRPELLRKSWLDARAVLGRVFPEYAEAPCYCHSWLLSPTLRQLLPPTSNILKFQQSFTITPIDVPSQGFLQWVFKNPGLPTEDLPENTGLQRRLKAFLLSGGTFVDAKGYLIAEPFL